MEATQSNSYGVKPDPEGNGPPPGGPSGNRGDGDALEITIKSQVCFGRLILTYEIVDELSLYTHCNDLFQRQIFNAYKTRIKALLTDIPFGNLNKTHSVVAMQQTDSANVIILVIILARQDQGEVKFRVKSKTPFQKVQYILLLQAKLCLGLQTSLCIV